MRKRLAKKILKEAYFDNPVNPKYPAFRVFLALCKWRDNINTDNITTKDVFWCHHGAYKYDRKNNVLRFHQMEFKIGDNNTITISLK